MDKQHTPGMLTESSHISVRSRRLTLYSLVVTCILGMIAIAVAMPEGPYKFTLIMLVFFGIIYLVNLIIATFGNSGMATQKSAEGTTPQRKKKSIARR